jgi:predicted transcriptional regulator
MRKDKNAALKLRRLGKSYNEIRDLLRIPKSTLSDWLHKTRWSTKVKRILAEKAKTKNVIRLRELDKIRGVHLKKLYQEAQDEARKEFENFKFHPTFISGVVIYWGEGDRSSRFLIRVANTDPLMIRLFAKFLLEVCGVPKERIRAHILLYPDLNPEVCKHFWIKESGLRLENFNKSVTIEGRHKTRRHPYGVCYIAVASTYLKQKMLIWLDLLPKELMKSSYYARG